MTKRPRIPAAEAALALLGASEWFGGLDVDSLGALVHDALRIGLVRGELYQLRGGEVEGVVLVAKGLLRVSVSSPEGKRHLVTYLEPGQVLNILPVIDGGPAIHDVDAASDVELILLPKKPFLRVLQERPDLGAAAQRLLNARFRLVYDGLADAILLPLRQRCARALLRAMDAIGQPVEGGGGEVSLRMTQGEVAEMLGNARPVVNRVLVEFQRSGIIGLGYQRIVVLKPDALRAAAHGSPCLSG